MTSINLSVKLTLKFYYNLKSKPTVVNPDSIDQLDNYQLVMRRLGGFRDFEGPLAWWRTAMGAPFVPSYANLTNDWWKESCIWGNNSLPAQPFLSGGVLMK